MQHVFIIGSRGLPAQYGGFETFVDELISHQQSPQISYHVACLSDEAHQTHFTYKNVDCFTINPPKIGAARVIAYDMMAISYALTLVAKERLERPIFYILGNTIGTFIKPFACQIHRMGGRLFVNPDGLEWKRSKWSRPVQAYLKFAERQMSRHADLLIADNEGIEAYLQERYPWSRTHFIAYGTELESPSLTRGDTKVSAFFDKWQISEKGYYLILGRFVPENNYETMIREFMTTKTVRDLVIVCPYEQGGYFSQLLKQTGCDRDARVKFVGTIYEKDLLAYLRREAFAYIHGHEVGGTNPGLLEALSQTDLNFVLDVSFNQSVAQDTAVYWSKKAGSLASLIHHYDDQPTQAFKDLGARAKAHMAETYSWSKIVSQYEELFLHED